MPPLEGHVRRLALPALREAAEAFRVLVINGPRQSGKSTAIRDLRQLTGGHLYDLDDNAVRAAALNDPESLVRSDAGHVYIDEFQRGGNELILAIKRSVDDPSVRTRYVLAGSTNFLTVPTLSESLAGRAVIQEIWPFSQGEIAGGHDGFLDLILTAPEVVRDLKPPVTSRDEYLSRITLGGYPEPLRLGSDRLRGMWFRSYALTVSQRDIQELGRTRRPTDSLRLLTYLAGITAQELVTAKAASSLGLDRDTVSNHLSLLETVFLVRELPAWSRNPLAKVIRRPKLHLTDTGLAASLQGVDRRLLAAPTSPLRGQFVESFIYGELLRQQSWNGRPVQLSHWRQPSGAEVDIVVESPQSGVVGVECKAASGVRAEDFKGLRAFREMAGDSFSHGFVFYLGEQVLGFGDGMTALPLSTLWAPT